MAYATEDITKALKGARQRKKLTQRALSAKAGVPQSHISKIESGSVDIKLSSLVELARGLDLEVVLVPRNLMPAVQSIIRSSSPSPESAGSDRDKLRELNRLQETLSELRKTPDVLAGVENLQRTLREFRNMPLSQRELNHLREAREAIRHAGLTPEVVHEIQRRAEGLRELRNRLAHGRLEEPAPPRPAYTLDEDESDG